MSLVDIIIVIAAISFAVAGYRQGFLVGFFAFLGFLAGGIGGIVLAPDLVGIFDDELAQAVFAVGVVLGLATVGQLIGSMAGAALRSRVTWQPATLVDAGAGAALGVVSLLLVAWFVGSALATAPIPNLTAQVRQSQVLAFVDDVMPQSADRLYAQLSQVLDDSGLTQVFGPFDNEQILPVQKPDNGALATRPIKRASRSVVKVEGAAEACRRSLEGSGFVYAPQYVMTNAHVVAGVSAPTVSVRGTGPELDAQVVLFDSDVDLAVLYVPDLDAPALDFDLDGSRRDEAIVAGFPLNGPYDLESARIRQEITARGPNIYSRGSVEREVFSLFARVQPGNSGGPLLSPDGDVYGVVFAKSVQDDNTGYALTADEVRSEARDGAGRTGAVSTGGCA